MNNSLKLISIILIAPLAYFFGKEFKTRDKELKDKQKIQIDTLITTDKITQDVIDLAEAEGTNLNQSSITKLKDIIIQTRELRKEITE